MASGTGTEARSFVPAAGARFEAQTAPEGVEPVLHVRQARASTNGANVEPATIIDHVDLQVPWSSRNSTLTADAIRASIPTGRDPPLKPTVAA